ncbi:MAG: SLC13/DASS family transporter [Candidatus Zixiibacteriota bacterium]|nr:MAG: SLC13/DASS family transporter [candidate division Zixibacteria bacterium]
MKSIDRVEYASSVKCRIGLILGPALALILLYAVKMDPANPLVARTAAVAVLMAVWWITEAIPIAATALLPVVLFPLAGIMKGKIVAPIYFNHVIFLFIGGFIVALAMQKWELHRRIALRIILLIGAGQRRIMLGFMAATAFLSMWISNTATTMMMVPIALAIIVKLEESYGCERVGRFSMGLLIGIAYAASIGGTATLIGTPPNPLFVQVLSISFPQAPDITFASWFLFGLPFAVLFLAVSWWLLSLLFAPRREKFDVDETVFRAELSRLGKMPYEEIAVLVAFILMALLWMFRNDIPLGSFIIPGWIRLLPVPDFIDDGTIAIMVALLLFLIPSRSRPGRLMDWKSVRELPWGIVLLFGGGFALASGFKESGLSLWLGGQLTGLEGMPAPLMISLICFMMTFLTELTSNTATTEMILPILGSLAVAIRLNPLLLMIPATLSASCAFMLPVATPPNAIIFGTNRVSMSGLAKTGVVFNLAGILLVTLSVFLVGALVFNISLHEFPAWANTGG